MPQRLGGFRAALVIGWITLSAAGLAYAQLKQVPFSIALPVLAAFLIEYPFYLAAGWESVRERLAGPRLPWLLAASALLPWLVYALGTGHFAWDALLKLLLVALALSFWYVVLPHGALTDLAYLGLMAAIHLAKVFRGIYPEPFPKVQVDAIGHAALIHIGIFALLVLRRAPVTGFGFFPARRDWWTGVRYYLAFLPVGFPLALWLGVARWSDPDPVWRILLTFWAVLWVVALSEELLFRGLLQQWIEKWTGSAVAAVACASLVFGLAHLWYGAFPNWRMVAVASLHGCFAGLAFRENRSVQASMVTHALVVTTWKAFLR